VTILRCLWCDIIVLNVHAPTEDKIDDIKDGFYKELELYLTNSLKPHENLLGDFNVEVSREDTFKPKLGMRVYKKLIMIMELATSKNLIVKSRMFPYCNIYKFTWTSHDGKPHNQIDHILIDRRRHSSILDVQSFGTANCDTDHI
jgi:exonuclease III